jgi:2-polyprenyl-6-methoxyphenol hydroxylase-like FAD-dependent oxidoreductase
MPTALIVGAGIGGLAAGTALRRAGWEIRIFEGAATPRAIGFAVGLAPNAMAALRELGVADAVSSHGITPTAAEIRRLDGHVIRRFVGRLDALPAGDVPRVILRPALHGVLLDALAGTVVEVNRAAVRFNVEGPRVRLKLADGTSAVGDILVGADGVGSTIRAELHPFEPPARPSGYFAVRGLSRAVDRLDGLQALWYFGRGVESGVVQASATEIYWFVSLLADQVTPGPLDVESVMRRSTAGFDAQFHAITGATGAADLRLDELLVREALERWGTGPVTLLGDAAHPMLPHTGQGAAQALEDAVGLGRSLTLRGDHVAALRRYEMLRSRRTRRVAMMGPRIARITTTKSPIVGFLRNTAIRLVPKIALVKAFTHAGADAHREMSER